MADIPTTNQPAQDAVTLVENLTAQGEAAAEAAILTAEPVMGTPVLKQLWEAIFDWLIKQLLTPIASLAGRVVIDIEEYASLKTAASAQAALDAAKKAGDPNAITKASQDVDVAVAGVIRYVGATRT